MAFAMIGRCFAAIALSGTIQMTYEVFPTVVRVRGVAVASAAGMTASFLAPFIIHSVREQTTQGVHPEITSTKAGNSFIIPSAS